MSDSDLFVRVDDTTWPVAVGETEWQLRYTPDSTNLRLHAAAIVAAYAHLTDPAISQSDAIAALKRARKAVAA